MVKYYTFRRRDHPRQGKHNALQRASYFAMPLLGVVLVLTGLAIWKPVQLGGLTALFGGYVWARYWHFIAMLLLALAALAHVFMVFTTDPYAIVSMLTGRYEERWSPEARNARPFVNLRPAAGSGGAASEDGQGRDGADG
jgi:thiosulfate reductase cytochrome b subunit